jgi:hypothetical protein
MPTMAPGCIGIGPNNVKPKVIGIKMERIIVAASSRQWIGLFLFASVCRK